jgi:hypothetical protein
LCFNSLQKLPEHCVHICQVALLLLAQLHLLYGIPAATMQDASDVLNVCTYTAPARTNGATLCCLICFTQPRVIFERRQHAGVG